MLDTSAALFHHDGPAWTALRPAPIRAISSSTASWLTATCCAFGALFCRLAGASCPVSALGRNGAGCRVRCKGMGLERLQAQQLEYQAMPAWLHARVFALIICDAAIWWLMSADGQTAGSTLLLSPWPLLVQPGGNTTGLHTKQAIGRLSWTEALQQICGVCDPQRWTSRSSTVGKPAPKATCLWGFSHQDQHCPWC